MLNVLQIASLEEIRHQTLKGILSVQKRFRGLKARRYFQELRSGVTMLQSCNGIRTIINTCINNLVFPSKFSISFAVIRGRLARKHFNGLESSKMSKTNHVKANGGSDFKLQELVVRH